ncbi:MAG TPA: MarR family transcriptional regulator [Candidatus Polarisedimenticolaceae bacterium]|nr:MarR family transcriptional regulator [Candidatus Polarisedimenticolaceae bacterium]
MESQLETTYRIGIIQAQAYRRLQNHYRAALKPYQLSVPEWSLLGIVIDTGSMTPSELAKALKSKVSHPSALIGRLEKRGLLQRDANGGDKRSTRVSLTPAGRKLIPAIETHVRTKLCGDLDDLSTTELSAYFKLLSKLAKGMEDE